MIESVQHPLPKVNILFWDSPLVSVWGSDQTVKLKLCNMAYGQCSLMTKETKCLRSKGQIRFVAVPKEPQLQEELYPTGNSKSSCGSTTLHLHSLLA